MSDEPNEHSEAARSGVPPEPVPAEEAAPSTTASASAELPRYARRSRSGAVMGLAALLIVVAAGVLSSPFWAAAVGSLLPWGEQSGAAKYDALTHRVAALEARPVAPAVDPNAIKSAQAALSQKITALQDRVAALNQPQDAAATKAALAQQSQRLDAAEAQSAARTAAQGAEIEKIQQQLAQRSAAGGELLTRLEAIEHQVHAQGNAERTAGIRLLALLQMREAAEAGRPFPAEYAAFSQLAVHDPELAAAARPLADPARDGVASPAELRRRLAGVANRIADASQPSQPAPSKSSWWDAAFDRVRALVTIRRIDGPAKAGPEAAVDAAQTALSQGDLAGAVAALDGLGGANAEAAQPWLKLARQRLAAQAALTHLQGLLTARLGAPTSSPAAAEPAPATATPPAGPKTPS
jgi:hypothetical protein